MTRNGPDWGALFWSIACGALAVPLALSPPGSRATTGAVFFGLGALVFALAFVRSFFTATRHSTPSAVRVTFDDDAISAKYRNGETRSIRWSELARVGIRTTDEGPAVDDVLWGLHSAAGVEVVYAGGAIGEMELLRAMQHRLPDFDHDAVIRAMCSTDNEDFTAWERTGDA
jgi:hypothetical protein